LTNPRSNTFSIAVVLSVYNGQEYLRQQLDSILTQTWQDFTLHIRDDGSTDNSPALLEEYACKDSRIRLIKDHGRNLGLTPSLKILLQATQAQIIFFADQDDQWLPCKMQTMIGHAPKNLVQKPCIIFSDLEVTDRNLKTRHPSFWKLAAINPEKTSFRHIIRKNCVTGCACAINRKLLELVQHMPDQALHDWWMASIAALHGRFIPIKAPLVRYRQHGKNVIGAQHGGQARIRILVSEPVFRRDYCSQLESSLQHLLALAHMDPVKNNLLQKILIKKEIFRRRFLKEALKCFS